MNTRTITLPSITVPSITLPTGVQNRLNQVADSATEARKAAERYAKPIAKQSWKVSGQAVEFVAARAPKPVAETMESSFASAKTWFDANILEVERTPKAKPAATRKPVATRKPAAKKAATAKPVAKKAAKKIAAVKA